MSTKQDELRNPASCLNRARPDEILFVLRSNDPIAPQVVRLWAAMAEGLHEPDKVLEALHCADHMQRQHEDRGPKTVPLAKLGPERGEGYVWPQVKPHPQARPVDFSPLQNRP